MKKILLYNLIVSVMILYCGVLNAQTVGTTAGQFLKIGAGARAVGMGGAYTGLSNDIYAVYYNPAGIANTDGNALVSFNHANWLADISYDFAAAAVKIPDMGVLFVDLTSLGVPQDKVRTFAYPDGNGEYWNASSLAVGVGFARELTDRFSIGFQAKYIRESIWNESASGFAIDVGTYYITPFNDLKIGASISNFGSKMQLSGRDIQFNSDPNNDINSGPNNILSQYSMDSFDLPLTFRIGLSMDILKSRYIRLTGDIDANHPNDNTEYLNNGLELAYNETFFIRAGYRNLFMKNSEGGLALGGGINYKFSDQITVMFNYGWTNYGRLNSVQFIDLGLQL